MTLTTTTARASYVGDGSTTAYAYPFKIFDEDDLAVYSVDAAGTESLLANGTAYAVSGVGAAAGGTVTFVTAPLAGTSIVLLRVPDLAQDTDIRNQGGPGLPSSVEAALDKRAMVDQYLYDVASRTLRLAPSADAADYDLTLPTPATGSALVWGAGGVLTNSPMLTATGSVSGAVVVTSATGNGVADDTATLAADLATATALGGELWLLGSKTYVLSAPLVVTGPVTIRLNGAVVRKNFGGASTHLLEGTGTVTATSVTLNANVAVGASSLSVASGGTAFADGDWLLVRDATYAYGTTGRNQEITRVDGTPTATTIPLAKRATRSYATASTATVLKLTPVRDVRIVGPGRLEIPDGTNNGGHVYGTYAVNWLVDGVDFVGPNDDPCVGFDASYGCRVRGGSMRDGQNASAGGYGYGVLFNESCEDCVAESVRSENIREHIITNGCWHCGFRDIEGTSHYDNTVNTHGSGNRHCFIENVTSVACRGLAVAVGFDGCPAPDQDITVRGVTSINDGSGGVSVSASGGVTHARVVVSDLKVHGAGRRSGTGASGILAKQVDGLSVSDVRVDGDGVADFAQAIYLISCSRVTLDGYQMRNLTAGYGLRISGCTTVRARGGSAYGVLSYNVELIGSNSDVEIEPMTADDGTFKFDVNTRGRIRGYGTSADNGDASVVLTAISERTQRFDTTLTAARTVTLPSLSTDQTCPVGDRFRIVRTGLGAFTLTVQDAAAATVKVMPSATAAYVEAEVSKAGVWKLSAYGAL